MSNASTSLWQTLQTAGLVQGDQPPQATPDSPWFVKVLLGFSGWFAALFVLGFLGAGFMVVFRHSGTAFVLGVVLIGVAYVILRIPRNEFLSQLALAISLAGQALLVFAIYDDYEPHAYIIWGLIALMQLPLAIFMPNFIHRVLSTLFACFAMHMFLILVGASYVFSGILLFIAAWLWLNEFRYPRYMQVMRAIGYGIVLAVIPLKGSLLFQHDLRWIWYSSGKPPELWLQPWMGEVLAAVVTVYAVWQILQRYGQVLSNKASVLIMAGVLVFSVVSMEAHGVTVGIVIILLGFYGSNRVLLGLGIIALLLYVSSYYYLMEATLLYKSGVLLLIGMLLLAMHWVLRYVFAGYSGGRDAD